MENLFGKMSLQKKVMRLKYKKNISLKEAWDQVLGKKSTKNKTSKLSEKEVKLLLNKLSFSRLKKIANKFNISCCRKGSKVLVKKSTLVRRMLKSKDLNKIVKLANTKSRKTKFGKHHELPSNTSLSLLPYNNPPEYSRPGRPVLNSWSDVTLANTQAARNRQYKNIPPTFVSFDRVPNIKIAQGGLLPSMAPYGHVKNGFGQYFH